MARIEQVVGAGAFPFLATSCPDPPGKVKVRSNTLGTKMPFPEERVRNAGFHVVPWAFPELTTNVPVSPLSHVKVPFNAFGACDGAAATGATPNPTVAAANAPDTTAPLTPIRRQVPFWVRPCN